MFRKGIYNRFTVPEPDSHGPQTGRPVSEHGQGSRLKQNKEFSVLHEQLQLAEIIGPAGYSCCQAFFTVYNIHVYVDGTKLLVRQLPRLPDLLCRPC